MAERYEVHPIGTDDLMREVLTHLRRYSGAMRPADAQRNFTLADKVEKAIIARRVGVFTLSIDTDGHVSIGMRR